MARVVITHDEAEREGKLPAVCMCCDAPAKVWITRRLMLKPPIFNQVELAEVAAFKSIQALTTSPMVDLRTSFCDEHKNYWKTKAMVLFGGLGVFLAALVLGFALAAIASIGRKEPLIFPLCAAVSLIFLGLFGWLAAILIVWRNPIRVFGLDRGLILVDNVSDAFASAVQATRPTTGS